MAGTATNPTIVSPSGSAEILVPSVVTDTLEVVEGLDDAAKSYAQSSRAANTVSAYTADWNEWTTWCQSHHSQAAPADPIALTRYLTMLAEAGAAVATMSRRLAAIKFAHRTQDLADPTNDARVNAVWEGIRRTHGKPPTQADPLMPPDLNTVLAGCPTIRTWKGDRKDEPHFGGLRDRALISVGFFAALRRSEIAAATLEDVSDHEHGLLLRLPRSKTNQDGQTPELVILPRTTDPLLCPVTNLAAWLSAADVTDGPIFRQVTRHNKVGDRLASAAVNDIVQTAVTRSGVVGNYSAHSLRAGFVTYAHLRGASDRAIAHQTRHNSLASLGQYVRVNDAWVENAANQLGL